MENTTTVTNPPIILYAIMNNDGEIVSVNKRKVHLTRKSVRTARDLYNRRDVRIVKGDFVLNSCWTPAK
ncbi:MAG: hypothetical protein CMB80_03840 [Flammeovirgaceae bacterium]|nr:hypothetical protein [Flammeovirgaceae bacterium]|tara:strand:+ start:4970 stop:5176 length:207 start_codon:yes stop_codon:yes gene_type:complete